MGAKILDQPHQLSSRIGALISGDLNKGRTPRLNITRSNYRLLIGAWIVGTALFSEAQHSTRSGLVLCSHWAEFST
jgi:hypothetical protein